MQQQVIAILMPVHYEYYDFWCPEGLPEEAELRFEIYTNKEIAPDILAQINAFPLLI